MGSMRPLSLDKTWILNEKEKKKKNLKEVKMKHAIVQNYKWRQNLWPFLLDARNNVRSLVFYVEKIFEQV